MVLPTGFWLEATSPVAIEETVVVTPPSGAVTVVVRNPPASE
ncbi:hypothetical protein [Brevundimonas sp.]|nr:hypothetical protein [Brevundimonas sp.]MDZ4361961.1 hypothetical protein [Brevundimonas sp.]